MRRRSQLRLSVEMLETRLSLTASAPDPCRTADFNYDLHIDQADAAILASYFGARVPVYARGDADGDGRVTLDDVSAFQRQLGQECDGSFVRFSAFGDYGNDSTDQFNVGNLVRSWRPDLILTLGDNNYVVGAAETIDANVGKYYEDFIGDYAGVYGPGSPVNRFFPSLGNHDWWYVTSPPELTAKPYLGYFHLPGDGFTSSSGNERYYDFVWGPVHFFALNSNFGEPHGRKWTSQQAGWLRNRLAASTSPWNVVYFHESPYSSGSDSGSTSDMQWPFYDWGADLVISAHDHNYERLRVDDLTYLVAGTGGAPLREMNPTVPGSEVRYNEAHGALLIEADATMLRAEFRVVIGGGNLIDCIAFGAGTCPELPSASASQPMPRDAAPAIVRATVGERPIPTVRRRVASERALRDFGGERLAASVVERTRGTTHVRRAVDAAGRSERDEASLALGQRRRNLTHDVHFAGEPTGFQL